MAKTLADFKKEFAEIQKQVAHDADAMNDLEHNLDKLREQIVEGFKALGAQIAELRAQGATGADIAAYTHDPLVAKMLLELQKQRDSGKKTGDQAEALYQNGFLALRRRMKALREGLKAEIAARQAKKSSKLLNINQSVKEMVPLQTEVEKDVRGGNNDWTIVFSFAGTIPGAQYASLYNDLLAEQLTKSAKQVKTDEKLIAAKGKLNEKVMKLAISKVSKALSDLRKLGVDAQGAQKKRTVVTLAWDKKAAQALMDTVNVQLEPYEKIMTSAKLTKVINESPDKDLIQKSLKRLTDLKDAAEQEFDLIESRKLAQ